MLSMIVLDFAHERQQNAFLPLSDAASATEFKIRDPSICQGSCLWNRQDVKLS
jgi:hypothetical protein